MTETITMSDITEASLAVFKRFAEDAGNWSGTPPIDGNVCITKEERGNLTQLKKEGYITTFRDEGMVWISFTEKGEQLAKELGIELR